MIDRAGQTTPQQARKRIVIGGKDECLDKIDRYVKVGVTRFIFMQAFPIIVEEEVQAFAEEVIPKLRG